MVRIDSDRREMVIDLDYRPARRLADMVLQAVWAYAASTDEDKAFVRSMADAVAGRLPLADQDLKDISSPQELEGLYSPLGGGADD